MADNGAQFTADELPDIPDSWQWGRLGDLVDQSRGICYGIVQPGKHDESGVPMVNSQDVLDGTVASRVEFRVAKELHARFKRSTIRGGEVLLTLVGANFGRVAIAPSSFAGFNCSRAVGIIPVLEHAQFVMFCLRSPLTRRFLDNWANTTAQPTFNLKEVANLPIPLPPLAEQKAIAAVLGALDDKIELNRRMNATLEAMARALFQSWFVDFDPVRAKLDGRNPAALDPATGGLFPDAFQDSTAGHIPSGWRVMKVGEFIERLSVGQKYEQKTVSPVGKVPVLDQGKSGIIGFHNHEPGVTATLDKPVAVFANHTCYMRLITYSFSAIQNVLPFVGSGVDTFWAYYATEGRLSFSEYKGHWPDFVLQESVVPPRELTDAFGRLAKPLVAQMRNNEEESRTLATLRDTLLPKLLSGELSVAEDNCKGN